jgi:hypothetical protein
MFLIVISDGGSLPAGYGVDAAGMLFGPGFRETSTDQIDLAGGVVELPASTVRAQVIGTGTLELPAAPSEGQHHLIDLSSSVAVTISGNGNTIEGQASMVFTQTVFPYLHFVFDSTIGGWRIESSGNAPFLSLTTAGQVDPLFSVMTLDQNTRAVQFQDLTFDNTDPAADFLDMPGRNSGGLLTESAIEEISVVGPTTIAASTRTVLADTTANAVGVALNGAMPVGAVVDVLDSGNATANPITITDSGGALVNGGANVQIAADFGAFTCRKVTIGGVDQWRAY